MLGKTTNPLLQKTEAATEAKVPPKYKGACQRIVAAGLRVMYSEQTHDMMVKELQKPQDPSINIGEGVASEAHVGLTRATIDRLNLPPLWIWVSTCYRHHVILQPPST